MSYGCFKFLTSEVEVEAEAKIEVIFIWGLSPTSTSKVEVGVEVEAEAKIEVRSIWGLSKSTSIQNFGLLTSEITELWLF